MNTKAISKRVNLQINDLVQQLMKLAQLTYAKDEQSSPQYLSLDEQLMIEGTQINQFLNKASQKILNQQKEKNSKHYSNEFKRILMQKITLQLTRGFSLGSILTYYAEQYGISKKTLQRWSEKCPKKQKQEKSIYKTKKQEYPLMQIELSNFVERNIYVGRKQIIQKGRQLLKVHYPQVSEDSFKFSMGWWQKFKKRHNCKFLKQESTNTSSQQINNQAEFVKEQPFQFMY